MIFYKSQDLENNFMKIALSLPGANGTPTQIDSGLPKGVPTGGLFDCGQQRVCTGRDVIHVLIELILIIAIFLSLYFMGRGGLDMITSGGEKERLKSGRERVIYAAIGLMIIFISFTMIQIIGAFFGFNLLPFLFK